MLYVVATPIGNLEDLGMRAKRILQTVAIVVCEDTRHSRILLNRIESKARVIAFHEHSDEKRLSEIITFLNDGVDVAFVSDAGTPNVSDPGGRLVKAANEHTIQIVSVPGPSAVTAALSVCGFAVDGFTFFGFLPKKKGKQTMLKEIKAAKKVSVFFESPERIAKTLNDCHDIIGSDREVCICRELSKQFEQVWSGTLAEAVEANIRPQGEFVLVVSGA